MAGLAPHAHTQVRYYSQENGVRQSRFYRMGLALPLLALMVAPVRAESINLMSEDGPIRLHIEQDGEVRGEYPKLQGIIHGHVSPDGAIHGMWMQPRSDHPCKRPRGDTYAWGFFSIRHLYQRNVAGSWGYCDEEPIRDWGLQRD
jgi:hypothetical protein